MFQVLRIFIIYLFIINILHWFITTNQKVNLKIKLAIEID